MILGAAHFGIISISSTWNGSSKKLSNDNNNVIAVMSDGAMMQVWLVEAMNNAGALKSKIIVILNDNDITQLTRPVGAMSKYLTKLLGKIYLV